MKLHLTVCLRRLLAALFCVQIVVGGVRAAEAPTGNNTGRMPDRPNFQPSAKNCARPVQESVAADRGALFIGSTVANLRGA